MGDEFQSFDRMFSMMQGFFWLFFAVVIGLIIFSIVKQGTRWAKNNASPEVSAVASIADKRVEISGGGTSMMGSDTMMSSSTPVHQTHYVTFQQSGGERFELEVPASEYGLLVVGDAGTVTMKGTRYLGFSREIMR